MRGIEEAAVAFASTAGERETRQRRILRGLRRIGWFAALVATAAPAAAQRLPPDRRLEPRPELRPEPRPEPRPELLPDLAIVDARAEQESDVVRAVRVVVLVRNLGAAIAQPTQVAARPRQGAAAQARLRALGPGESQEVILHVRDTAGTAGTEIDQIFVAVDPLQQVRESDERNNSRVVPIALAQRLPDLVIAGAAARQDDLRRAVQVVATVRNAGSAGVPGADVAVRSPEGARMTRTGPLAPGQAQEVALELPLPRDAARTHEVIITVDPEQRVRESDERNNARRVPIAMPPRLPDLTVGAVRAEPDDERHVERVVAAVRNDGRGAAPGTEVTARSPWGTQTTSTRSLAPGEVQEVAFELPLRAGAAGTHEVTVVVDPGQRIGESDEGNNVRGVKVAMPRRLPDLTIAGVRAEQDDERRVERVVVTVRNQGQAAARAASVEARSPWDGQVRTEMTKALAVGSAQDVAFELPLPAGAAGTGEVAVAVDPDQRIGESDEGNNARRVPVVIAEVLPDLAIARTRAHHDDERHAVQLVVTVRNQGRGAAPATEVEARAPWGEQARAELRALGAGDSQDVTLALAVPRDVAGEQDLRVAIDPDHRLRESDETDNADTVRVTLPDRGRLSAVLVALAIALLGLGAARIVRRWWRARGGPREEPPATPRLEARVVERGLSDQHAQLAVAPGDALELALVVHPGRARSELHLPERAAATGSEPWPAPPTH